MSNALPSEKSYSNTIYLLTFIFLICISFLIYYQVQKLYSVFGPAALGDLWRFWVDGNLFFQGHNPNNPEFYLQYSLKHASGEIPSYIQIYYPAFSMVGFLPFALFSFDQTRFIYVLGTILIIAIVLGFSALRSLAIALRQGNNIIYELVACAARWSFFPALLFLWNGAVTFFPFLGLAIFLFVEKSKRTTVGSIIQSAALILTLVKPSVCYLALTFIIARWLRNKSFLPLAIFALGFITLWLISRSFSSSLAVPVLAKEISVLDWATPTLVAAIQQFTTLPPYTRFIPSIIALFIAAIFGWLSPEHANIRAALCCVWIPASLVFVPYAWTYDFIMLAFTLCYLFSNDKKQEGIAKDIFFPVTVLISNLGLIILPITMHLHWWYPVVFLMLGVKYFSHNNSIDIKHYM